MPAKRSALVGSHSYKEWMVPPTLPWAASRGEPLLAQPVTQIVSIWGLAPWIKPRDKEEVPRWFCHWNMHPHSAWRVTPPGPICSAQGPGFISVAPKKQFRGERGLISSHSSRWLSIVYREATVARTWSRLSHDIHSQEHRDVNVCAMLACLLVLSLIANSFCSSVPPA